MRGLNRPESFDGGNVKPLDKEHYSYRVYEDQATATEFDALRFGGAVGELFRKHQEDLLTTQCPDVTDWHVLDLGAGTGRTAIPLSRRGAHVIAADASMEMLNVAREKAWLQGHPVNCSIIDAHHLPFPDGMFDLVLSFRMLMHVVDWTQTLREICRVSRRRVIIDFPPVSGFAGLAPFIHPIQKLFRKNHQSYRVFTIRSVSEALSRFGFTVSAVDRHIVLPFGLHRFIGSVAFTTRFENFLKKTGVTDLSGAPVTIIADRITE